MFETNVITECLVKISIVVYLVNIKRKFRKSLRMQAGHERAAGCGHLKLFPPNALTLVSVVQRKPDFTR